MSGRDSELSSLLSSAGLVLIGGLMSSFSLLLERIIVGRMLSVGAYGEVSIGIALLSIGVTLSLVGFSQGVPRYISRFDSPERKRGVWISGVVFTSMVALALVILLFPNVDTVAVLFFESVESERLVQLFVLCIPLVVAFEIGVGAIRGLENTTFKLYVEDLLYPGARILLLVVLLLSGVGLTAPGYAYLIAATIAAIAAHLLLNRLLSLVGSFQTNTKELLMFSGPLVMSTIFASLLTKVDTFMLGYFRTSYEVGLYNAAYPLANGILVVLSSFGFLYLPLASRLDASDERREIDAIYKVTTKWIYIVTFPAFLTFVVFPGDVLALFFGEDYRPAAFTLIILTIGFFTNAAYGRNRETLSALGYTMYILIGNSAAFVLNIVLNLLLIPVYGITGAAITSVLSFASFNLLIHLILKQGFNISPFSRYFLRTVLFLLVLLPPTVLLSHYLALTLLTLPIFLVLAGLASIVVISVGNCLQPEDAVAIDVIEERIGLSIPLIRRFIPENAKY
jgi:O-antigen/teichoic acid export membrane protein